ncbi:MAG TPA: GNAT family N-acetyltransferase [Verrucomicrobiae bacterium]|jgi:dTDP-4-amino-4,6-dideoxy-D-galactose acyltransferase|nr:GNAT family N-acetyltransferase [Verrucomicrobiae bacterium]
MLKSIPCELLPWDTEFFGFRIARVCGDTLKMEQVVKIDDWSRSNRVRGLYFLSRADDPATIQTAEQHGFGLVDIRVTLERRMMDSHDLIRSDLPAGICIRPVQPNDLSGLRVMARRGHGETRFFSDSHFSRQRTEDLYSTWITLEVQGRAQNVFVAASGTNQPLGYISCHLDPVHREGQIGLVGVSPEVRGRGIGKNLVQAAIGWFRTQGAQKVTVITQGNNQAAQRLYQQCGFLSRDLQLWYHKWYPILD